ncbi:MAG: 4-hydroxy-tetrahydrodipicolinate synthase [Paludibacteraceae bacterium]|nr:4-hydroxy-tetrahydrodipicolinate synthase [Paludibacteraceae bacterium]MCR5298617.1 4-hydroxy-tetrahydrodipicolinate synthase [Paludibacteraceae bacterium]
MGRLNLTGLGIALITPFNEDESVDYESLGNLLDYQLRNGANYFVVLGTTAETPTLSEEEKEEVKRFIVKRVNHRVPLILGCGGNCTSSVVEQAKKVDPKDFDAILSVSPYYNKPSQEGLYQHFKSIADASPVPVVLYNVPGRTGVNISASTTLRLAGHENVIAIKEASGNMSQIDEIIENKPKDFVVISGDDGITFPLITLGAVGVISVIGNAFPAEFSRMVRLTLDGDYESARKIHRRFSELFSLLFVDGNPAGVKSMLSMMGFAKNKLRLPLVPTTITTFEKIKSVLDKLNIKIS